MAAPLMELNGNLKNWVNQGTCVVEPCRLRHLQNILKFTNGFLASMCNDASRALLATGVYLDMGTRWRWQRENAMLEGGLATENRTWQIVHSWRWSFDNNCCSFACSGFWICRKFRIPLDYAFYITQKHFCLHTRLNTASRSGVLSFLNIHWTLTLQDRWPWRFIYTQCRRRRLRSQSWLHSTVIGWHSFQQLGNLHVTCPSNLNPQSIPCCFCIWAFLCSVIWESTIVQQLFLRHQQPCLARTIRWLALGVILWPKIWRDSCRKLQHPGWCLCNQQAGKEGQQQRVNAVDSEGQTQFFFSNYVGNRKTCWRIKRSEVRRCNKNRCAGDVLLLCGRCVISGTAKTKGVPRPLEDWCGHYGIVTQSM